MELNERTLLTLMANKGTVSGTLLAESFSTAGLFTERGIKLVSLSVFENKGLIRGTTDTLPWKWSISHKGLVAVYKR